MKEYPLSRKLLALSRVWKSPGGEEYVIAAKGAPEAIMDLCHFSSAKKQELSGQVENMAGDGLRVLGVAKSSFAPAALPGNQHDFQFEFLGFVGFDDPIRPAVRVDLLQRAPWAKNERCRCEILHRAFVFCAAESATLRRLSRFGWPF